MSVYEFADFIDVALVNPVQPNPIQPNPTKATLPLHRPTNLRLSNTCILEQQPLKTYLMSTKARKICRQSIKSQTCKSVKNSTLMFCLNQTFWVTKASLSSNTKLWRSSAQIKTIMHAFPKPLPHGPCLVELSVATCWCRNGARHHFLASRSGCTLNIRAVSLPLCSTNYVNIEFALEV